MFRLLAALLLAGTIGPAQSRQQGAPAEKPLVRVNVDLVQMDAIVTDAKGNHIPGLTPEEFEVLENGKAQRITNFSFIPGETPAGPAAASVPAVGGKGALRLPLAPARITPGQVNRTIAVVIDDFGIGEQSFASIHRALERFVEQQVEPGDLIAIVTTSGRLGALQQLTGDKRLLRAAVAKFRSIPNHRPGVQDDDFTCVWFNHKWLATPAAGLQDEDAWLAAQGACVDCPPELDPQLELMNDRRSEYYSRLSVAALRRVVDGLRELPGRKSILLFSEGMPLLRGQGVGETNQLLIDAYNAFLAHANRSAVAVNTIDPRGLLTLSSTVEHGHSAEDSCAQARQTELVNTQQLLAEMARKTGGISIKDDNDLSGAIARVMDDQLGYYLIGYKPSGPAGKGTPESPALRKIAIRVTRPGLKVRFHSSLYEEEKRPAPEDSSRRLAAALASPFTLRDVRVRLSSRFWDAGAAAGSILDTVLQVDAHDLAFSAEADGHHKAVFDVLAVIYGAESKPLDTFGKSYTISLTESAYQRALLEGLVQRLELPAKRPGAYQVRGAVRDRQADRTGSAIEFVEVPDLARGRLALSGLALSASPGSATLLRYRPGQSVFYAYQVLNAHPDRDGSIHVEVQATLFHDGPALGTSKPILVDTKDQPHRKRLVVTNDLRLGKQLHPGDYTLQLTAVDKNAPARQAAATQSIDFEVVE